MYINGMCVEEFDTLREGSIAPQNTEILWKCLGFHRMLPETAQIQEYPVKHFLLLATCLLREPTKLRGDRVLTRFLIEIPYENATQ